MSSFNIGKVEIGKRPAKVVAEIGQAHDGSLGAAHAYIDAVAKTGAHAIKFQTHIAAAESTPGEPFRIKFSKQDKTRYEYWQRMEFAPEHWAGLAEHAKDAGLEFMSSAFSMEAVELLEKIGVPAWKVGAGEITNYPMLERMAGTAPVLLSSGMATWEELDRAVEVVKAKQQSVAVFQCTSSYPCPPEKLGLNVIAELRARYGCPVGLSDHSGAVYAGLAATALDADLIEVHVVFSRDCFGPDTPVSLTPQELTQLVEGTRFLGTALDHPVDKARMAESLQDMRNLFTKSIVAGADFEAGHQLTEADLLLRKPGTGLPAEKLPSVVGRRLRSGVSRFDLITDDVLE